ncbi:hypothetical protein HMPREF1544_05074 [Mucor circinelloides 1006PhL]|uniref:F-box domain-containing protein n=1 Tax=Mucor circinelloides f. circinelloides (strain 1006PhL) TaxID=1220926 RepID=S2K7B1_MUCC1|nr:hypothetical protein HMPREF1544_05074 [Mucor circinelloides 1006PhL]
MWSHLPQELQIKIFGLIDSIAQLAECRLVCKCWYHQADSTLLGQHIILENDKDIIQLYTFLNGDPVRGSLVKNVTLLGPHFHDYLLGELVCLIFTPTLEKFKGRLEGCGSNILFEINLNALTDVSNFDRLTILPTPQKFTFMYFNTLVKFKESLQSMALYLNDLHQDLEQQRYIMERLQGFKALVMLDLKIKINNVTDAEQILQHFTRLEWLRLEIYTECAFIMSEKRTQEWTTNSVAVVESLKSLEVKGCIFGDVFEYLCYKYASIHTIKLDYSEHMRGLLFTTDFERIVNRLMEMASRAEIDATFYLPDYVGTERLTPLLNRIGGTKHLTYDAKRKLIIWTTDNNPKEEST